jgi:hypothetical protein
MLNISPEKVCYIIIKAREFDVKVEPDDPASGSNPADDNEIDVLEDFADDPTYDELLSALRSLNEDESLDLVALAWVGRGTYSKNEWGEARRQAQEIPLADRPRYLTGTPMLGDYLEQGLSELGYSCDEFEMNRL